MAGKALNLSGVGLGLFNSTLLTANGALMANSITPITWTGSITLSGNTTIDTAVTTADTTAGNVNADLTLSGNISGPGGLTKVGSSILYLTGADTYAGATTVEVGTLDIGGSGSLLPATAPGSNEVQTISFSGTITNGSTFTLAFNGATTSAIGYSTATGTLQSNIQNALNALATIGLSGNTNTLVSAVSASSVTITFQNQLGVTNVPQLTLNSSLTGTNPRASVAITTAGVAALNVLVGATFTLDDTTVNLPNRLSSSATIALNGGTLSYLGNNLNAIASAQTVGAITLGSGNNTISVIDGTGIGSTAILTSAGLLREAGATVNFIGSTTLLGGAYSQIQFTSPITAAANGPFVNLTNGILPYATVQGPNSTSLNFASYASPGGITAFTNYVNNLATANSTSNVILTSATTLSANVTVNSLLLLGSLTLTAASGGNNFTLTVASGGLVASSGGTATLTGGTLNFGTAEGVLTASTALTINSSITGTGGLTASGAGTVTLNGTGVYTGSTVYDGGGINVGNFAVGVVSALGNTTLTAISGVIGTSFGGAFSVFSNPIILNNSVVGFGLAGTQPTIAGPITLIGNDFIQATGNTAQIAGSIGGSGTLNIGPSASKEALILAGNNTYTGGTNLDPALGGGSDNELDVISSNAFGTGPINWLGGQIDTFRVVTGAAVESASGVVTIPNQINLINATPEIAGPWYQADGLGYVNFTGNINVTGSSIINTLISANLTITGVISGTGNLTFGTQIEYGGGPAAPAYVPSSVTLTNANTISGGVSLQPTQNYDTSAPDGYAGQLILENSAALGTGIFTFGNGILQDDGVTPITLANNIQFDAAQGYTTNATLRSINATNPNIPFTITGLVTSTAALANVPGETPGLTIGGGNVVFDSPIVLDNTVVVDAGTMTLAGQATLTSTGLAVNPGATLAINNTATNTTNRVAASVPISLTGGTLIYEANTTPGAVSTETFGTVTLNWSSATTLAGSSTIINDAVPGTTSIITLTNLTRTAGTLINFTGQGQALNTTTNQIIVSGALTPTPTAVTNGNILPYASVTGPGGTLDFAAAAGGSQAPTAPYNITAFTGYVSETLASASNSMDVVKVTANDNSLNSTSGTPAAVLIDGDNITITGTDTLNLATGALLVTGATTTGDTLAAPLNFASASGEGLLVSNSTPSSGNAALNVTGAISNSADGGLTIGGTGSFELSGVDTYTGTTTLASGIVVINNSSAFGAAVNVVATTNATIESGSAAGITIANPIQLNTGIQGLGVLTFTGVNPLTLAGVISGFGGITVNGSTSGPLTFTGTAANTFDGDLIMNSGTLLLSKTGTTAATAAAVGEYATVYINGGTIQQTSTVNELQSFDSPNVTISSTNAVQTLTFSGVGGTNAPSSGTFTLIFNGATTGPITYSSVATTLESNIQSALNVLSTVGGGNSFVTLPATSTNGNVTLMVEFCGALAGFPQTAVTPVFPSLLPSGSSVSAATAVIDGIPQIGAHGTFALGANLAQFDTLTFINGGDVTMTTGTLSFYDYSGCIQTFAEPLIPSAPVSASNPLLPSTAEIVGGTTIITAYTNNGSYPVNIQSSGGTLSNPQQAVALSGVSGGNFTLSVGTAVTTPITFSTTNTALASNIQAALNALSSVAGLGNPGTASVKRHGGRCGGDAHFYRHTRGRDVFLDVRHNVGLWDQL